MTRFLNRITPYVFLTPAALVVLLALGYPLTQSILLSFQEWSIGTQPSSAKFVGLENYLWLLNDESFWISLGVTIVFAASVVVLEVTLGVALALTLDREMVGMSLFRTIFILPMMVAPIVVGLIWRYMYNQQFGVFAMMAKALGLPAIPFLSSPNISLLAVIIADVWQWTPFIFILSLAALQSLPASALEAARIDGANGWKTLWHIKLPLMTPVIAVAALLRLIDAFKVLEVVYILTDGGPGLSTEILSLHIYKTAFVSQQLGRASALSNLLLLLILVLTVVLVLVGKIRAASQRQQEA